VLRLTKTEMFIRYIFIALSIVAIVDNFIHQDMVTLASAGLTLLFLLLPPIVEKLIKITIPVSFRLIYLGFIISSMYLGEINSFFYRIPFWDIILHTASAMMLAYLTLLFMYIINRDEDIDQKLSPFFAAMFVFCVPVAMGAIWELFEFAVDKVFGVNMIKAIDPNDITRFYDYERGFFNSLHDMVMDISGAFVIALSAFIHLNSKGKYIPAFRILIKQFIKENPSLF